MATTNLTEVGSQTGTFENLYCIWAEIQTSGNFEANKYRCSYLLGCIRCRCFMPHFCSQCSFLVHDLILCLWLTRTLDSFVFMESRILRVSIIHYRCTKPGGKRATPQKGDNSIRFGSKMKKHLLYSTFGLPQFKISCQPKPSSFLLLVKIMSSDHSKDNKNVAKQAIKNNYISPPFSVSCRKNTQEVSAVALYVENSYRHTILEYNKL